ANGFRLNPTLEVRCRLIYHPPEVCLSILPTSTNPVSDRGGELAIYILRLLMAQESWQALAHYLANDSLQGFWSIIPPTFALTGRNLNHNLHRLRVSSFQRL